jgi:chorismate dehydratase
LPGLAIASDGPVRSILFETTAPPESLDGARVALPTASATSVVLLRALLELRHGARPAYHWFSQGPTADPVGDGAAAALWIGDVALGRPRHDGRRYLDLGAVWKQWTGLPFVYALWQTPLDVSRDEELGRLSSLLAASHAFFLERMEALARREAAGFGLDPALLLDYWRSLHHTLDDRAVAGLLHFFSLAAELGGGRAVTSLRFVSAG